jgi:hypothetical protein
MNDSIYPPPLPQQHSSGPAMTRGGMWFLIGLAFALVQFAISETAYQIADRGGPDFLFDVSNTVAWPAAHLYDWADAGNMREVLLELSESDSLDSELYSEIQKLLEMTDTVEFLDAAWDFAHEQDLDAELPIVLEYLIYGGTCLLWGVAVGVGGYLIFSGMKEPESFTLQ